MRKSNRARSWMLALSLAAGAVSMAACTSTQPERPPASANVMPEMPGRIFAERTCSGCHSIERTGDSPHPDALPFRRLSEHYPVRDLEEAFGEGIFVGHPDMPPFRFSPDEIDNLLDYLEAIQDPV